MKRRNEAAMLGILNQYMPLSKSHRYLQTTIIASCTKPIVFMYMYIQCMITVLHIFTSPCRSGLVETGEREVVHFTDLKLLRRANNTR